MIGVIDYGAGNLASVLNMLGSLGIPARIVESEPELEGVERLVLPKKFGVDKRRAHLSNLILSGEITRDETLTELEQPMYDLDLQQQDLQYVSKKLGFTVEEMEEILGRDPIPHETYGTDEAQQASLMRWVTRVSKLRNVVLRR